MDYKEKYEQALSKARQFSEKPYLEDSAGIVEYIFPELKEPELAESEDERIRKEIMALIEWSKSYFASGITNDDAKKMLNWLEKQGQVKESTIPQHENKTCKEKDDFLTCEDERISREITDFICWSTDRGSITKEQVEKSNSWLAWLDKQGEQKPAELPKGEDYGIDGLWHAISILQRTLGEVEGYQSDDGILEHKCAISAVKELYERKPSWSEEDERILSGLISSLARIGAKTKTDSTSINYTFPREIDWLKSLKDRLS